MVTSPARTLGGWVRIGVNTDAIMLVLATGLSMFFSFVLFREPLTSVVEQVTGAPQNSTNIAFLTAGVLFVILAPLLVLMTNRPIKIDLDRRVMRVGWRTVSFDQVRHAYQRPGGDGINKWILQLEVAHTRDARLPILTSAQPNLSARELGVLLAMLKQAPIEPKPGETVRAPVGDELGPRDAAERVADRVSEAIMPHQRVAFAKQTLILKVQKAWERAQEHEAIDGAPLEGLRGIAPTFATLLKAMNQLGSGGGGGGSRQGMLLPDEPIPQRDHRTGKSLRFRDRYINHPLRRGMLGTCGPVFLENRKGVEGWLRAEKAVPVRLFVGSRLVGWAIFLLALPAPWISDSPLIIITWPFILWASILLIYRARIRRYLAGRTAAMSVLQAGKTIPRGVHDFYGPRFPERTYGKHLYALGIGLVIVLIFPILIFVITGSFSMMAGWTPYEQEWEKPLWPVVLVPIVLSLALAVRGNYATIRALARATAEWRLLRDGE